MATEHFYNTVRPTLFSNSLSQHQVDGIEAILNVCEPITDIRQKAYVLATIYHECAKTMQPITESGKGRGHKYGQKIKRDGTAYIAPDQLYYGRGYVQLTWYENYQIQGKILSLDLLNHPEWVLQPAIAGKILLHGMTKGDFTGHYLGQYFNATTSDYMNARKIINGLDCAELIAGYAHTFFAGLSEPN